jgi:hypothetical protein
MPVSNSAPLVSHPIADQITPGHSLWTFQFASDAFADPDGDPLSYAATLANGDPLPSWLMFEPATRMFSGPPPDSLNGTLDLLVTASDATHSVSDIFRLTVIQPVATPDAPVIVSNGGGATATISLPENIKTVTTVVATDVDSPSISYSISGGADAAKFQIDAATGALSFIAPPDFEAPTDSDHDNSYVVQVRASDGALDDDQMITVSITDVVEPFQRSAATDLGSHGAGWTVAGVGDFDGNGIDDVLWRNTTTGRVDEWRMKDGNWSASIDLGSHGAGWQVAAVGDFDGDGTSDVLWRETATGKLDAWIMANGQWSRSVDLGSHGSDWQVLGAGDFNGDHVDDILFQNATTGRVDEWQMAGGDWSKSIALGSYNTAWTFGGIGDLDHDGTSDILWHNPTTGQVDEWHMADGNWAASIDLGSFNAGYQLAAVNDFNGDGTSDVLWRNPTTGSTEGWLMQSGQWFASVSLGTQDPAYRVAGTGDFNHAGGADILWHSTAGQTQDWPLASI